MRELRSWWILRLICVCGFCDYCEFVNFCDRGFLNACEFVDKVSLQILNSFKFEFIVC